MTELDDYLNKYLNEDYDEDVELVEKENILKKVKKILTEIVKIGGWIIVAIEKLLEIM